MTRLTKSMMLGLLLLALVVIPVAAQSGTGIPIADGSVYLSSPNSSFSGQDLLIEGSLDPGGNCTPVRFSYMKWDLSAHAGPVSGAVLTLTTTNVTSQAAGRSVALYRVDDNWDETVTWNSRPTLGILVQPLTLPAALPTGTVVTFNDPNLTSYINEEIGGDKVVSLALAFTSCANGSLQQFQDRESGAGVAPRLEAPTAVTLTETSAQQANTLPLYAGLGALGLIAVAGLAVSRRRTAAR